MTERAYTLKEIDLMRAALAYRHRPQPMSAFSQDTLDRRIEDDLRLQMTLGTDPNELIRQCGGVSYTAKPGGSVFVNAGGSGNGRLEPGGGGAPQLGP